MNILYASSLCSIFLDEVNYQITNKIELFIGFILIDLVIFVPIINSNFGRRVSILAYEYMCVYECVLCT